MIPGSAGIFSSQNTARICATVPTAPSPDSSSGDRGRHCCSQTAPAQEPHTEPPEDDGGGSHVVLSTPFSLQHIGALRLYGFCLYPKQRQSQKVDVVLGLAAASMGWEGPDEVALGSMSITEK